MYPKALIADDYSDQLVNSALNCALISWATNRKIGAKTPADYIEQRAKDAQATDEQVRKRLESHLIPYDELISGDYELFLDARSELIHERMLRLVNGEVG